jgi:hypothetical protein
MRTLVVYYSRTGTTERIAKMLAAEFDADMERIRCPGCNAGGRGLLNTLLVALGLRAPPIVYAACDPSTYDLVLVGTPVWAWSVAAPVRAWLHREASRLPEYAVFATAGGSPFRRTFAAIETLAGKPPRATLGLTAETICSGRDHLAVLRFSEALRPARQRLFA